MYIIPQELLREFRKVSSNSRSPQDGRHVETLAYLIGYQSDGNLIGTDLVFPKQSATSSHVDDIGKYFCLIKFLDFLLLYKFIFDQHVYCNAFSTN